MQLSWRRSLKKLLLVFAALTSLVMFTGVPVVQADNRDCQRRIVSADHRLDQAVARHGVRSRQAERARNELRAARERCWNNGHRWWDEHERRWRTERDWDDHDHDRDDRHSENRHNNDRHDHMRH
jgi:hypothetical protein